MIPSEEDLIGLKVEYEIYEEQLYFNIDMVGQLFPDLRFPPEKVKELIIEGTVKKAIRREDMHELTDFEKKLIKLYNFKK